MKRIIFNGLGPQESVSYDGKLYYNGAVAEMEDGHAAAYLSSHLAVMVDSEEQVAAQQFLEKKNAATRKRVQEKAEEAGV